MANYNELDKNPIKIKEMFDEISPNYDKVNKYMSLGTQRYIKSITVKLLDIKPGSYVLDLCCGTGDIVNLISKQVPNAKIIGLDFSANMLKLAKQNYPHNVFMLGDCTNLPFKDNEFDYVTISFGLRNIEDRTSAIKEIHRVLSKGGYFLHLDFGYKNIFYKAFYNLVKIIIKLCKLPCEHYLYLLKSVENYPNPDEITEEFTRHNFKLIKRKDFFMGAISAQVLQKF